MANILSAVTGGLQSYCDKVYSCSNFNQVWILKYREDLLNSFNSRFYSRKFHLSKKCTSTVYKPFFLEKY